MAQGSVFLKGGFLSLWVEAKFLYNLMIIELQNSHSLWMQARFLLEIPTSSILLSFHFFMQYLCDKMWGDAEHFQVVIRPKQLKFWFGNQNLFPAFHICFDWLDGRTTIIIFTVSVKCWQMHVRYCQTLMLLHGQLYNLIHGYMPNIKDWLHLQNNP